jgi:hypothetical protein
LTIRKSKDTFEKVLDAVRERLSNLASSNDEQDREDVDDVEED